MFDRFTKPRRDSRDRLLSPGVRASLAAALGSAVLAGALGPSAGVPGARDALPGLRPASVSYVPDQEAGSGAAVDPGRWRAALAPALHAAQPRVVRPVPHLAAPTPGATIDSIPVPAREAYQRAASVLAVAAPSCRLSWTLLAGVGRVESDHGRYGGATLGSDGVSRPAIIGVPLNGVGPVAAVRDTDAGLLDGDRVWDHAVGPLQFLPSTWAALGVDADGDGKRSPNDIDDAALAAGVDLCAGTSRLDTADNARAALLRYNHSDAYASLVMAYADHYAADAQSSALFRLIATVAPGPEQLLAPTGSVVPATSPARADHGAVVTHLHAPAGPAPTRPGTPASAAPAPAAHHGAGSGHPSNGVGTAPAGSGGTAPAPASGGPSAPAPTGQEASPAPSAPPPTESPSPEAADPSPVPQVVDGVWTQCDGRACLDGHPLALAGPAPACEVADHDYDGDGSTEQLASELAGLNGQTVAVTVLAEPAGWRVLEIRGLAWSGISDAAAGSPCPGVAGPSVLP